MKGHPKAISRWTLLFLIGGACYLAGCSGETGSHIPKGVLVANEENWEKEVLQSNRPVLVDFWATWCGPCLRMKPTLGALARDFKVCMVDVDTSQKLAAHYEISGIPAVLIFKQGQLVARYDGLTSQATLRARMNELTR